MLGQLSGRALYAVLFRRAFKAGILGVLLGEHFRWAFKAGILGMAF